VTGQAPLWVSVEGIEGAGKTYLCRKLASHLGAGCLLVGEITDQGTGTQEGQVVAAMLADGDPFLRTGHPAAETLALLALKARAYTRVMSSAMTGVRVVLEDRGPDSVAAYQPAILDPAGTPEQLLASARQILATAAWSRPLPDLTLLITDDPGICEQRFATRTGHPVTGDERTLMRQAAALYELLAQAEPQRWRIISRKGRTSGEVLAAMATACTAGDPRTSAGEPGA
jgi:dTMP kinase